MAPGLKGQAKGHRAFCSWDEDSVTMAVEAARDVLGDRARDSITAATLATTTPPFADLAGSGIVANALGLDPAVHTLDVAHSVRAGTSGLAAALRSEEGPALFIASDRPRGKPASAQEINYGAGAAAFLLGTEGVVAETLATLSRTEPFVDHFRAEGARYDYYWEERWIRDAGYLKIATGAIAAALRQADVRPEEVRHFIFPSPFRGAAAAVAKGAGIPAAAEANSLDERCGYAGAAHAALMLALTLEQAKPGDVIVMAAFGQGADVLVLRATDAITGFAPRRGISGALADAQLQEAYLRFLSYEGGIEPEWGMRSEKPVKSSLTEQHRSNYQLGSFVAGKCRRCGTIQFPQMPYCVDPSCVAPQSEFESQALFDEKAAVLTYTADWLSYHPAPPLYVGFVQFNNGARLLMEMVDVGSAGLDVGTPLRIVFRIKDLDKARGYPRYFWKATPLQA
ncbi:MAG: 3-oxoacyl-[acyl-carrier-protein] synthase III C-terminal domain-containing protein [Burkholderiales bacterium]